MADEAGHQHKARIALTAWPQKHPPREDAAYNREKQSLLWGLSWDTAQALLGAAGRDVSWKAQHRLSKTRRIVFY